MKPGSPPSSVYYEYHEDIGHTTEQCFQLSNLVEGKILLGQLVHYVKQTGTYRHERRHDEDRVIYVIFGGIAVEGASNNPRKKYAGEVFNINPSLVKFPRLNPSLVISFSNDD